MYLSSDVDDQDGYTVRRHPDNPGEYLGGQAPGLLPLVVRSQNVGECT